MQVLYLLLIFVEFMRGCLRPDARCGSPVASAAAVPSVRPWGGLPCLGWLGFCCLGPWPVCCSLSLSASLLLFILAPIVQCWLLLSTLCLHRCASWLLPAVVCALRWLLWLCAGCCCASAVHPLAAASAAARALALFLLLLCLFVPSAVPAVVLSWLLPASAIPLCLCCYLLPLLSACYLLCASWRLCCSAAALLPAASYYLLRPGLCCLLWLMAAGPHSL